MKIHILFDFVKGPYGGGNQFLKALNNELKELSCYENDPEKADVILFNSHHNLKDTIKLKNKYSKKIFVQRVDGPMAYRGIEGIKLDKKIFLINSIIADGTVFQSQWSRQQCYNNGMKNKYFEAVIHNAPDPTYFFPPKYKQSYDGKRKIKLIITSWSNNANKGFDIYHFLDEKMDFSKYEMTIVGRVDKQFKNIRVIKILPSRELAEKLRQNDIFIFASKIEACSNSLLEALHCGLPAIVRNTTSNPEILNGNGELFQGKKDILEKIDDMAKNILKFRFNNLVSLNQIALEYKQFCEKIILAYKTNKLPIKKLNVLQRIRLKLHLIGLPIL